MADTVTDRGAERVAVARSTTASADAVIDVVRSRPATWLRPFLRLAAAHAATGAPSRYAWYRMGRVLEDGPDRVRAHLVWWPHGDVSLFRRFAGELIVEVAGSGAVVSLEGSVTGGDRCRNRRTLALTVRLLADAIEHGQPDG